MNDYHTWTTEYDWPLLLRCKLSKRKELLEDAKALRKQRQKLLSIDPNDEAYRLLNYVRYADDALFGFAGPRSEAEKIKEQPDTSCLIPSSWRCPRKRR